MNIRILTILSLFLLWPLSAIAMSFQDARHLLSRTGYEVTWDKVLPLLSQDHQKAVHNIVYTDNRYAVTAPPSWINDPPPNWRQLKHKGEDEKKAFRKHRR